MVWDYLGSYGWVPFSSSSASPGVITCPAHGFSAGDSVVISSEYGGTLPTGFTNGLIGTVATVTTDTFNIATNTTSTGSGNLRKIATQVVPNNTTVNLASGNIVITLA